MRLLVLGLLLSVSAPAFAADSSDLQNRLDNTVKPFVGKYCVACHSGPQPTGQFDLKSYTSMDQVKEDFPRWSLLADRLTNHEMPPKQMPQPPQDADRPDRRLCASTCAPKRSSGWAAIPASCWRAVSAMPNMTTPSAT